MSETPDWPSTIQEYIDRIAELEAELAEAKDQRDYSYSARDEIEAELANRVGQVHWKCKEIEKLRQERDQLRKAIDFIASGKSPDAQLVALKCRNGKALKQEVK